MSDRDRVLRYLRREATDGIPFDIEFNGMTEKVYAKELQGMKEKEFFNCPTRDVHPDLSKAKQHYDFESLYKDYDKDASIDEWGIRTCVYPNGVSRTDNPMKDFCSAEALRDYPFPDYANPACYTSMKQAISKIKSQGHVAIANAARFIFAMGRELRGYENHMMDYYINQEFNEALLNQIMECQMELVKQMALAKPDILWLCSDVASQDNVLLNPKVYRETVAWRMKKLFFSAKRANPDILCLYHCCGNVMPIIDDIVDFGTDILNPIQPESLNFKQLKKEYGDKLVFWGGVSCQKTMPRGKPEDIKREIQNVSTILGDNGGFVISPSNLVTPDTPWENITAFVEEAKKLW